MCGRFVRYSSIHELAVEFSADEPPFDLPPSYNVAPSQDVLIITNHGEKRFSSCRWGFLPSWAKDPKIGYRMINARAETVADKPSFRGAFMSKRILVAADGFYEWQKKGAAKTPFFIGLKSGRPFGFAGLLNVWVSPEGKQICTCTVLTTEANSLVEPVHDRMPVIIRKEDEDIWLDPSLQDKARLASLLRPYAPDTMDCYEVSEFVNSPSHNSPECIKRI